MKKIFVTLFALFIFSGLFSQTVKYEFASVSFSFCQSGGKFIGITTPSGYTSKKVDYGTLEKSDDNLTFFFQELYTLQDEGWEVMEITAYLDNNPCHVKTAFLRRTKK